MALPEIPAQPICDVVMQWSTAESPEELPQIAVVQTRVLVGRTAAAMDLEAGNDQSSEFLKRLKDKNLDLTVSVTADFADNNKAGPQPIAIGSTVRDDEVPLKLQQTRSFALKAVQKVAFKKQPERNPADLDLRTHGAWDRPVIHPPQPSGRPVTGTEDHLQSADHLQHSRSRLCARGNMPMLEHVATKTSIPPSMFAAAGMPAPMLPTM